VKPGLHRGLSFDEYAAIQNAANHSTLEHFRQTPLHARHYMLTGGDEETAALRRGWATHAAVLEPDRFAAQFVAAPKVDRRTKDGKAAWADFQAANTDRLILTDEEMDLCQKLRAAVWSHPTAAEILAAKGMNEVSLVWKDAETEVDCKGRIDRICSYAGWSCLVDLKTTRDAGRRAFESSVQRFGYHSQAAFYIDGAQAVAPRDVERKWLWIAVETEAPYACAVYEIEDAALSMGRDEYRKHLRAYAECLRTGEWPGYPAGIDYCGLPSWAYRAIEGE
jgi:hypothetical protein